MSQTEETPNPQDDAQVQPDPDGSDRGADRRTWGPFTVFIARRISTSEHITLFF